MKEIENNKGNDEKLLECELYILRDIARQAAFICNNYKKSWNYKIPQVHMRIFADRVNSYLSFLEERAQEDEEHNNEGKADKLEENETDIESNPNFVENNDFGACCACGVENKTVRNLIGMAKLAPQPGTGWRCFACDLPPDGAMAIICDQCLENKTQVKWVINGDPAEKNRCLYSLLSDEPFEHDLSKHEGEAFGTFLC